MSITIKNLDSPPDSSRLCSADDRKIFFWDGDGVGPQTTHWGSSGDPIEAMFVQRLDDSGDALCQVVAVDSEGRVQNYKRFVDPFSSGPEAPPGARGIHSVDLQTARFLGSSVASGDFSCLVAGIDNTASGNYSSCVAGSDNTASGICSSCVGGYKNTASGGYSSCVGGTDNTASGNYSSCVGGSNNTASGDNSVVLGGSGITAGLANTAFVQNLNIGNAGLLLSGSSFLAASVSTNQPTVIQFSTSDQTIQIPANAPIGTIKFITNTSTSTKRTWTCPGSYVIVNHPAPNSSSPSIELDAGQAAILVVTLQEQFRVFSLYDPPS